VNELVYSIFDIKLASANILEKGGSIHHLEDRPGGWTQEAKYGG